MKQSDLIISADPQVEDPFAGMDDSAEAVVEVEQRHLSIAPGQHGARLDRVLVEQVAEFSRSYLQQLIVAGAVQLKGAVVTKPSARVHVGEVLVIELRPTLQSQAFKPQPMALDVVFEDEHLLVINKPAGLVVHPAPGNWSGTLLNGLLARDPQAQFLPRAGIVHRLDKDTSGLMVVARTRSVMDALVRLIAARDVSRQYLALAHGAWVGPRTQRAQWPIGRDPRNRLRMAAVDLAQHSGKAATTDIELLENAAKGCWVRCTLHTGRTHQIRVHMMMLGHPLVGDTLYGGSAAAGLQRQALHAFRLAFVHPVTGEAMEFRAGLPEDMSQALRTWGLGYNGA